MRKETINTFSDGMSLDLNPLGTPAKTLTNCLNGTLVTYNGNELTLQNDMGNVEVGTAALPKGYVPVGMKEYGGIIYVASYNPETKKGLLGCFPSPQQIYVSEAALTVLEINIEDIFLIYPEKFWNDIPIIDKNEYKEEIFKDYITLEAKIFNTGDKFIIKTDKAFSDVLRQAIDDNIIVIKLFIIPTNGEQPIEISSCERDDLRLYEEINSQWRENLWIFQNDGNRYLDLNEDLSQGPMLVEKSLPFETILNKYRLFLQTYPGPQGTLELVFEFNTFKLFNLYRKYYKIGADFDVLFIGEGLVDDIDTCNIINEDAVKPFLLSGNINYNAHNIKQCEILSTQSDELVASTDKYSITGGQTLFYDIMPTSKYGALKLFNNSFLKSGELTNLQILDSHNKVTNWDFEIDTDAVTIKWTYTTFDGDPEIDHMRIVLIPLDKIEEKTKGQIDELYVVGSNTPTNVPNIYKVEKLLYSGDFEDRINFVDNYIEHNYIYLCRLDVIYKSGSVTNGQEYKLLYTGTFFNNKDVLLFNYYNRPQVEITPELQVEQSYIIKSFNYTVLMEGENGIEESLPKEIVNANDVMFLADHDKYYNKIIGIVLNAECEVTSTLSVDCDKFVKYEEEETLMKPYYAGNFNSDQTLDACATGGKIYCKVADKTKYVYEGDGDEEILEELKNRIEKVTLVNGNLETNLDDATIVYTKLGNTYRNTSTIKIHRGIISRFGQEDFYTVSLESLFPVYDPDDTLYNEKLFGFQIEDDGSLSNIIGGENFLGLSMWLAKNRALDATTSVKDSMIAVERTYSSKTGISRYDFNGDAGAPYHYGSYISEGVGIINYGSEGTSRIEAMQKSNYAPIQIVASNRYERVWDKSYWDGKVDGRICNLMVLPHSEFGENLRKEFSTDIDLLGSSEGVPLGIEKHYGRIASKLRNNYILGVKDNVGDKKRNLFKVSKGNTRGMYILWRSQYGYQLMNIATPLDIESNQTPTELITVTPKGNGTLEVEWDTNALKNKTYPASETHLRADHMLICMLSLILITKRKNADLLLNAPNVAQIYQTLSFKTLGLLTINNNNDPVITLNGKNIENLLNLTLSTNILEPEDIYIPKFFVEKYTNGYINCGGKISNSTDRFGLVNLEDLFYAEGLPSFSTVTPEQRLNIYPGVINKVLGMYLCLLEKDYWGIYKINLDLMKNGKFYKIFLPTVHSQTNKEGAKYSFKNINTYKLILEGFAYNDVLFPLTRVLKELGKDILNLNAQEDVESPFFNLLYYNSIDLKFEMEPSNDKLFVMHDVDCGCPVPVDYCHGFAFITLFGDLSRYLDASVYARNVLNETKFYSVDFNLGYTNSSEVKSGYRCCCHDVFGKNRRSFVYRTLPAGSNLFKLGTEDWHTSTVTQAYGERDLNVSDTSQEVNKTEDDS